jgi:hypothetical protein
MKLKHILAMSLIGLAAVLLAACNQGGAVSQVSVNPAVISPNGDGTDDLTRISYKVSQTARVTIYLTDQNGKRYLLRDEVERTPSPVAYELLFNGVSEGHLLPDGQYTWHVDATGAGGTQNFSGQLVIKDANLPFPKISEFTLSTQSISPNRDAIDDHVYINVVLGQKAKLNVYVIGANGFRYEVQRVEGLRLVASDEQLEAGRYTYDYDGGINLGADPPPNGRYNVVAQTQDLIGQQDMLTRTLEITQSGRPVAEIVVQPDGQSVEWSTKNGSLVRDPNDTTQITLGLSETLYFTMAVRNTGTVPIRTAGPFDGNDCYNMDQNYYTKGFVQESGAFRVGVDFETNTGTDHPWRWGVGTLKDLDVVDHNGTKLYYLAPDKQVVVSGCIRFTRVPPRNPFSVYASLIQEDVEIQAVNYHVSPVSIVLVKP